MQILKKDKKISLKHDKQLEFSLWCYLLEQEKIDSMSENKEGAQKNFMLDLD